MSQTESVEDLRLHVLKVASRLMREHQVEGEPQLDISLGEDGLGLDSLGRLDLMGALETECGLVVPKKFWSRVQLKDLNELIRVAVRR